LIPTEIQSLVIPVSSFIAAMLAVVVQFVGAGGAHKETLKTAFRMTIATCGLSLLALVLVHINAVTSIRVVRENRDVSVITGFADRLPSCPCESASDEECLSELTLSPGAASLCWPNRSIKNAKTALTLFYLLCFASFGWSVGYLTRARDLNASLDEEAKGDV
jgi:hypothetical protein